MNRRDVAAAISHECGINPAKAAEVLDVALRVIADALSKRDVRLKKFGTFERRFHGARDRFRPVPGSKERISYHQPAYHTVKFVPSPTLRRRVRDAETL